jgi:hypothetical protein
MWIHWEHGLHRFERGPASACFEFGSDDIVDARVGGLVLSANAGALSVQLLHAGAEQGAAGVLCTVEHALVALPPIGPQHYGYVPPALRSVPVAVVVSAEQLPVYAGIAEAAARTGAIRRAFPSREQAQAWLREQARALAANRVWGPAHRSLR